MFHKIVHSNRLAPIFFFSPTLLLFTCILIFPIGFVIWSGFHKWNLLKNTGAQFIGFENYQNILTDANFWNSFQTTILFVVMTVPTGLVLGLLIALLFNPMLCPCANHTVAKVEF